MRDRKFIWPWIVVCLAAIPLLYVASIGPACWIAGHGGLSSASIEQTYSPMLRAFPRVPQPMRDALGWYICLGIPRGKVVILNTAYRPGAIHLTAFAG